jgi:hypothetical protein
VINSWTKSSTQTRPCLPKAFSMTELSCKGILCPAILA